MVIGERPVPMYWGLMNLDVSLRTSLDVVNAEISLKARVAMFKLQQMFPDEYHFRTKLIDLALRYELDQVESVRLKAISCNKLPFAKQRIGLSASTSKTISDIVIAYHAWVLCNLLFDSFWKSILCRTRYLYFCVHGNHICINCSSREESGKSAGDVANIIIGTEEDKLAGHLFRAVLDLLCCGKHADRNISWILKSSSYVRGYGNEINSCAR